MLKYFKALGVSESDVSMDIDIDNPNIQKSTIALVKVNIQGDDRALKNMYQVVSVINENGYDIESFFSNILIVVLHSDIETFQKHLAQLLNVGLISVVVSNIVGHVGSIGTERRQNYGHLSSEVESVLLELLHLKAGSFEIKS
jgi:hypothetical protein